MRNVYGRAAAIVVWVSCVVFLSASRADDLLLGEERLLVSAPEGKEFNHLSWPKIARTENGTLVLAYSAGIGHNIGGSGLAVSVSNDDGASFSLPEVLKRFPADDDRYRDCGNLAIGVAGDGAVILLAMAYDRNERNTIFGYRSEDEGQSWTRVDTSALAESRTGSVYGHVFSTGQGRLAAAGHYRRGSSPHETGIWLSYSDDNGRTWNEPDRIVERELQEPALIHTHRGFVGLVRSWGAGRPDYSLLTSEDGSSWTLRENALGIDSLSHRQYPSPFIQVDPANPDRLWVLKSYRGFDQGTGGISLWTADLAETSGIAGLSWERVGQVVQWKGEDPGRVDFTYPWMAHLKEDQWILVFYSGQRRGRSDLHGLTLRLDPETGSAWKENQTIGKPVSALVETESQDGENGNRTGGDESF